MLDVAIDMMEEGFYTATDARSWIAVNYAAEYRMSGVYSLVDD